MNSTLNKWDVGSQQIEVNDEDLDISFRVLIQYPAEPSQLLKIGPYTMDMSENAEIIPEKFPLVLLSHGNGGSHFIYHTITTYIVKNGYIVAMVEHYGNNRNDNHLENSAENLVNRPRHIKRTIDKLLSANCFGKNIDDSKSLSLVIPWEDIPL